MTKQLIYIVLLGVAFAQCSKKTADTVMEAKPAVEKVMKDPAVAWRSSVPKAGPAREIKLGNYTSFQLENGLDVIVVENHKLPRVSYQISFNNDPLIEGKEAGYTSMAGSLLTKGTKTRTKAQIDEAIDFVGASLNAGSSGIFGSSLKKHSGALLEVMTDVLYNPTFPEEEFEKEKKTSMSNLASQKTDPSAMSGNVSQILNFGADHPYGEIQTEETLNAMKLSTVKNYYKTYFRPNNATLVIVGDITPAEAESSAKKYFDKWEKGDVPMIKYNSPMAPEGNKVAFVNKDGAVQSVINITYPVDFKPGSVDAIPARIMNSILGGGIFSGRLMQNLREDKAYTYGARSSLRSDKLAGTFKAGASVRNEVTDSSITEFIYEMKRMATEPVDAKDVKLSKSSIAGSFARSLESPQTIARFARNIKRYNLPANYYETYLQKLDAVSVADVQSMAKKYIKPDNAYIVVVGNKDEVAEKLLKFDADGKIDYYDAYGIEVKYDEVATPDDVTAQTIVADYIDAMGGKEKLMDVKSMITTASMDMMGQSASISIKQKDGDKMAMTVSMNGMAVQDMKVNGDQASVGGMGQSQTMSKGDPGFDDMASQAKLFEALQYMSEGYMLELKGIEDVEGDKAYKLMVTRPSGKKTTEYYSVKSGLVTKVISNTETPQGVQTITNQFKDYKAVDGVMLPFTLVTIGAAPFPIEMKVAEYKLNSAIPNTEFMIK